MRPLPIRLRSDFAHVARRQVSRVHPAARADQLYLRLAAMTTHSTTSPVTRETPAYVRDKGFRAVIVTITGGLIELRAKGLRTREVVDVTSLYQQAVKARVMRERAEKKARKGARKAR